MGGGAVSQPLMRTGSQSGLLTRIAATESGSPAKTFERIWEYLRQGLGGGFIYEKVVNVEILENWRIRLRSLTNRAWSAPDYNARTPASNRSTSSSVV